MRKPTMWLSNRSETNQACAVSGRLIWSPGGAYGLSHSKLPSHPAHEDMVMKIFWPFPLFHGLKKNIYGLLLHI